MIDNNLYNCEEHNLVTSVPGWFMQMKGKILDTIFLDFAKAFDKIDFAILLEKPKSIKSIVKLETV